MFEMAGSKKIVSADEREACESVPLICNACDPTSDVAHYIQVSRIRIANLCCSGEERLIRVALSAVTGIEKIDVNIIGRYCVIRHCPHDCCAPALRMVDILNKKRLGASIQEVSQHEDEEDDDGVHLLSQLHAYTVSLLFVIGLILHFTEGYEEASNWVYISGVILGCIPILKSAVVAIMRKTIDISILMLVALVGALAVGEYFDGSLLVALVLLAELIEGFILASVRKAIRQSATSVPKQALLANGDVKNVEDLAVGDVIAVRAGEMILGDGVIKNGEGVVDESAVTGEAMPLSKTPGQRALSGTVMQNGYLEIEIDTASEESTLRKLRQAVQDVQADKGQYAAIVDKFAQFWTPGVLIGAGLYTAIGGGITSAWDIYIERGLILLVLACPCAIVLAAPIPTSSAIARAAKNGVLIKGSSVIEAMANVDIVAVDKTGTLTKGFFKVDEQILLDDNFADEHTRDFNPLQLAAAIEAKSTHPLAHAVVAECLGCIDEADTAAAAVAAEALKKRSGGSETKCKDTVGLPAADSDSDPLPPVKQIQVVPGVGVSGWVLVEDDWKFVMVGNERMLRANGGKCRPTAEQTRRIGLATEECGGSRAILMCAVDDELCLLLALSDELREESADAVAEMQNMRIGVHMLTGDQKITAEDICRRVGIPKSHCLSRLLPLQKQQWVQTMQTGDESSVDLESNFKRKSVTDADGATYIVDTQAVELLSPLVSGEDCSAAAAAGETITAAHSSSGSSGSHSANGGAIAAVDHPAPARAENEVSRGQHTTAAPKYSPLSAFGYRGRGGHTVCMVGDGVNDGAALAAADVGVAMGAGGSAIAVTAADCVLMTDNLLLLAGTLRLCREVRTIIIQNCVFALAIKFFAICLALAGQLVIWQAVLIDMGSLLVVVANGTRILNGNGLLLTEHQGGSNHSYEGVERHSDSSAPENCCGGNGGDRNHDHKHALVHSSHSCKAESVAATTAPLAHSRDHHRSPGNSGSAECGSDACIGNAKMKSSCKSGCCDDRKEKMNSANAAHGHDHAHDHKHGSNHTECGSGANDGKVVKKSSCKSGCCDDRKEEMNSANAAHGHDHAQAAITKSVVAVPTMVK